MKSFKVYFEQNELARTGGFDHTQFSSLEEVLQSMVGKTVAKARDPIDLAHLYITNVRDSRMSEKILNMSDDEARELQDFLSQLTRYILKDVRSINMNRTEDSDEFKKQHGYDDYLKAQDIAIAKRKKKRDEMDAAKDAGDEEKYREIRNELMSTIRDWEKETEYGSASSEEYAARMQRGEDAATVPLTAEFVKDDGSEQYGELADAATKVGIRSSRVINV